MGDMANVVIDEAEGGTIYLYTHWAGTELPATLQTALKKRWRWDDESYLTRIIQREMIRGIEDEETGAGISTYLGDNSYPFLRVNSEKQTVTVDFDPVRQYYDKPNREISFENFIAIEDIDWPKLGHSETEEDEATATG